MQRVEVERTFITTSPPQKDRPATQHYMTSPPTQSLTVVRTTSPKKNFFPGWTPIGYTAMSLLGIMAIALLYNSASLHRRTRNRPPLLSESSRTRTINGNATLSGTFFQSAVEQDTTVTHPLTARVTSQMANADRPG